MPQPLHIASRKHHADSLADELRFLPDQRSQRHHTRGLDHKHESFLGELPCLYNFLFSHHKEPRHVPSENRRVNYPRLVRRLSASMFGLGMGTIRFCFTESIYRIQDAGRLTGKDGHARSERLCPETEVGKQDSTTDWR